MKNEDICSLGSTDAQTYLALLTTAVDHAKNKLSELGKEEAALFVADVGSSLGWFRYARTPEDKFGIPDYNCLRIDPSWSGFPCNGQWTDLRQRQKDAAAFLAELPSREEIAAQVEESLWRGEVNQATIEQLVQRDFYSRIQEATLVPHAKCTVSEAAIEQITDGLDRKFYDTPDEAVQALFDDLKNLAASGRYALHDVKFTGLDVTNCVFITYNMRIARHEKSKAPIDDEGLGKYLRENCAVCDSVGAFVQLATTDGLLPISIEKWLLGPFYCNYTEKPESLIPIFEGKENPYLLRFHQELAQVEDVADHFNPAVALGRRKTRQEYAICPYSIEREFQESFKVEDVPFTIYGV